MVLWWFQGTAILINFPTGLYNTAEEGRIPYVQENIKTDTGELFNWIWLGRIFTFISKCRS